MPKGTENYFILIAADSGKYVRDPKAFTIAQYRLQLKKWGFTAFTRNRKRIGPGDKVVVYISGMHEKRQTFVASAEVTSPPGALRVYTREPLDGPSGMTATMSQFFMELTNIHYFKTPVSVLDIKPKLKFIKDPTSRRWGGCLQGGCVRIPKQDFKLITALGK